MVQYIITPWRSQRELLEIRECFYTGPGKADEKAQKRAVEKVSVWMQRGNCPHSVESTAILLSARMNDVPANSNYCVRAAYSAAFSRLVDLSLFFWLRKSTIVQALVSLLVGSIC